MHHVALLAIVLLLIVAFVVVMIFGIGVQSPRGRRRERP